MNTCPNAARTTVIGNVSRALLVVAVFAMASLGDVSADVGGDPCRNWGEYTYLECADSSSGYCEGGAGPQCQMRHTDTGTICTGTLRCDLPDDCPPPANPEWIVEKLTCVFEVH